jgi:hypothetical protein
MARLGRPTGVIIEMPRARRGWEAGVLSFALGMTMMYGARWVWLGGDDGVRAERSRPVGRHDRGIARRGGGGPQVPSLRCLAREVGGSPACCHSRSA